jgi:hypothetical protein
MLISFLYHGQWTVAYRLKILPWFVMIATIVFPTATAYIIGKVFISFSLNVAAKSFTSVIAGRAIVTAFRTVVGFEGIT